LQPFCSIPFLSSQTRSYVSVQVHPSCANFCKSSVSAEPQSSFRMPILGEDVETGAPSYPSRLKDSDFSSVHPINCYPNLNKQHVWFLKTNFSFLAFPILLGVRFFFFFFLQLFCKLH
jgi:hypothetical protein